MALLGNFDKEGYTKTGNGPITSWANKLSFVNFITEKLPFIGKNSFIGKLVGAPFSAILGYADTILESGQWLMRGQIGSAATVAAAGFVGNTVNGLGGITWWNVGSAGLTGVTLGTHARALTESMIGGVSGALGHKPQVLQSYQAGIGSTGASAAPAGPGRFVSDVARSRGEDADAAYKRLTSNQSDHLAALEAAQGQSAARGM